MKLTIDRMSLLRPLGHVQSVVERRNTIPILANVVLRAEEGIIANGNRYGYGYCHRSWLFGDDIRHNHHVGASAL